MEKLYIAQTNNTGKGIFAKRNIKKNETAFIVKGRIIRGPYSPGYKFDQRWLAIDNNAWIAPLRRNPWRFINHSCEPNAGLNGKVTVVAMQNIKKGEEITIDYSITEDDPYWEMDSVCNCGESNCRKIIRSVRFLPEEIFKKYKPYVRKFLEKSYMLHNSE